MSFLDEFLTNYLPSQQERTGVPLSSVVNTVDPQSVPTRNGGFLGTGSSFRDILGHIGDALLIQGGHPAMYKADQDAKRIGDIIRNQPNGALSNQAIGDIVSVDPALGDKIMTHTDNAAYRDAMLGGRLANWQSQEEVRKTLARQRYLNGAYALLRSSRDDATYQQNLKTAQAALAKQGIDITELGTIPEQFNRDTVGTLGLDDMKLLQLGETQSHHRTMEGIGQQNATANTTKAGAAVTQAGAAASRAGTYAATAPIQAEAARVRSGKMEDKSGGPPTPGSAHPAQAPQGGRPPGYYRNKTTGKTAYWDGTKFN